MRVRYEPFGGIIALDRPAATLFVDRDYMREIGWKDSELWWKKDTLLSAPITAHFAITNRCPMRCHGCYNSSGQALPSELSTDQAKEAIDTLAEMNVFTIAFGGGEPLARDDIFELAAYAKKRGINPTMTTNGFYLDEEMAKRCRVFSHIHVSLDGVGDVYKAVRGVDGFRFADRAIGYLRRNRISIGVNCVVTRKNYDHLEELCRYLRKRGVRDVLFLRFKPAGRALDEYNDLKMTPDQARGFYPKFREITKKYKLRTHVDCAMLPFLFYHDPDTRLMELTGGDGCKGAIEFVEVSPDGQVSGCSFSTESAGPVHRLPEFWRDTPAFAGYRDWIAYAPEPCASCDYLELCRGGCHIAAAAITGSFLSSDPDCPFVAERKEN